MIVGPIIAYVTPVAILFAAGIVWLGNCQVQRGIHRYIRLIRSVDDLKRRLHDFVDLSANYWTLDNPRTEKHKTLEAQIIARKRIIQEEFVALEERSFRLKKSYRQTIEARLNLWSEATGGRFQEVDWEADPERVIRVAAEVRTIIRSHNKTH